MHVRTLVLARGSARRAHVRRVRGLVRKKIQQCHSMFVAGLSKSDKLKASLDKIRWHNRRQRKDSCCTRYEARYRLGPKESARDAREPKLRNELRGLQHDPVPHGSHRLVFHNRVFFPLSERATILVLGSKTYLEPSGTTEYPIVRPWPDHGQKKKLFQ